MRKPSLIDMELLPAMIVLPPNWQRHLDAAVNRLLYPPSPSSRPGEEFLQPAGEAALAAPDSVSWQVCSNPLALFIGGVAAVILELAEPRVCAGVWQHTRFAREPLPRLQRTAWAAMMTVFGPRNRALAMIAEIARLHGRIAGVTAGGLAYRADDPQLLRWVHATASFGFLEAYRAYVGALDDAACDRFYQEAAVSAQLYGATGAPTSRRETDAMFDSMRERLEPSAAVFEFLEIMQRVALLPRPMRALQPLLIKAAIAIVPPWLRKQLGLTGRWRLVRWQRRTIALAGAAAERLWLPSAPPAIACRRLGLPPDYLYRRGRNHASPQVASDLAKVQHPETRTQHFFDK